MADKRKILLALQFWNGDKARAMEVARLIADLEPRLSEKADFLFVSRFDCSQDEDTIKYVSRKFYTHHYINRTRGEMWPHGCNALWFGTMDWVYSHGLAKRVPDYKAVLTFEADAFPLAPNWVSELHQEWDRVNVKVLGALQSSPGPHINGNALFSGDPAFLKWVAREKGGCRPSGGWDYLLASEFRKRGWSNSNLFRSWWGYPTMTRETFDSLVAQGVVFFSRLQRFLRYSACSGPISSSAVSFYLTKRENCSYLSVTT